MNDPATASHAAHKVAIGDAGCDKERVVARDEFVSLVNMVKLQPGVEASLAFVVATRSESGLDEPVERLDRACRGYAFWAASRSDAQVQALVRGGRDNAPCHIAI